MRCTDGKQFISESCELRSLCYPWKFIVKTCDVFWLCDVICLFLELVELVIKDSEVKDLLFFFHHTKPLNGWTLTPCGATHGLWSFWLWGLLRNVGVIGTSVGHRLLGRLRTGALQYSEKSRKATHINTIQHHLSHQKS